MHFENGKKAECYWPERADAVRTSQVAGQCAWQTQARRSLTTPGAPAGGGGKCPAHGAGRLCMWHELCF